MSCSVPEVEIQTLIKLVERLDSERRSYISEMHTRDPEVRGIISGLTIAIIEVTNTITDSYKTSSISGV